MSKQRKERAMPEAEIVQFEAKPLEPVITTLVDQPTPLSSGAWWGRIEELRRRQTTALAERAQLTARLGTITLAATGKDDTAEAELARVRARLVELQNVEAETAAAIAVAEARRTALVPAEEAGRRIGHRRRCAELVALRRRFAEGIDERLAEVEALLAGFRAAGAELMPALRHGGGGSLEMGGVTGSTDAATLCDAVQHAAPTLAGMLGERGFEPSSSRRDAKPLAVHDVRPLANVEDALRRAAEHDLAILEDLEEAA